VSGDPFDGIILESKSPKIMHLPVRPDNLNAPNVSFLYRQQNRATAFQRMHPDNSQNKSGAAYQRLRCPVPPSPAKKFGDRIR